MYSRNVHDTFLLDARRTMTELQRQDDVASRVDLSKLGQAHPEAASGAKREKLHTLPYDLVPFDEITQAYVRVAEFGAKKYEPWNWSKGLARVQLLGSLLRHAFAFLRGEECDRDSGLSHADHILWNAAALVHNVHWNLEDGRRAEPPRTYKNQTGQPEAEAKLTVIDEFVGEPVQFYWVDGKAMTRADLLSSGRITASEVM